MAYIGRGVDKISNIEVLDAITFTDSAGPYNLLKDTVAFTPTSSNALVISIDGVVQSPDSYTISAATITFDSVMAASSTMDFMYQMGVGILTAPSDGSVTAARLATDAVETAKIKDLNVTVGKLPASVDLSTKTITLPASVSGLGTGITNAQLAGSIDVTTKITGVVPTANLGSGTASSSTYLAGDQTYKTIVAVDIAWQAVTTTTTLTAVAGRGYPIDTTSNACTVTLPASASVGDQIIFTDYARNLNTNAVTLNQNSLNYQGNSSPNPEYDTDGETVHIVYMDATKGWIPINDGAVALETAQAYSVDFLVIAGGAGGGGPQSSYGGAGGGAGGYRTSDGTSGGGASAETALSFTPAAVYTITVGAGGAAGSGASSLGSTGVDSSIAGSGISTKTSAGGGGGGSTQAGADGGSGGGAGLNQSVGAGTANQGYAGGLSPGSSWDGKGGGGGASAVGQGAPGGNGGAGGAGLSSSITGASVARAGGGGGGSGNVQGTASDGGGGAGSAGTANTGGGGGGATNASNNAGAGGKGVVILSMLTADYTGTTSGSPTVIVDGSNTILVFNSDGSYTA